LQARRLQRSLRCHCLGACAAITLTDDLVFKSVDESLAAVLGLKVRDAVYLRLLMKYSLTRDEIPRRLNIFQRMLEDSFGPHASKVLTKAVARRLYSELHLPFTEHPAFGLPEYIQEAQSKLLETKSQAAERRDAAVTRCRESNGSKEKDCN